jgi:hypothetical protein
VSATALSGPTAPAPNESPPAGQLWALIGVRSWRLLNLGALLAALAAVLVALNAACLPNSVGIDFEPLRAAAGAVLAGHSVYSDPLFVYPPTATVLLFPFAAGSAVLSFRIWVAVTIVALVVAAVIVARVASPRHVVAGAALLTTALVGSAVASDSLGLGNLSPVLVPFAVYALLSFERGNWVRGCVVLTVSLLLKPLLAPLLLLPIVRRQWAALAVSLGPGALALTVAIVTIPGARELSKVARFVLGGTNLHGRNANNNLSLHGWGEYNHHPGPAVAGAVVVAVVGLAALVRWARAGRDGAGAVQLGSAILLTVFLAGRISEVHFLLVLIATVVLSVALRPGWRAGWAASAGLALLVLPHGYLFRLGPSGAPVQTYYVLAELVLLWAMISNVEGRS